MKRLRPITTARTSAAPADRAAAALGETGSGTPGDKGDLGGGDVGRSPGGTASPGGEGRAWPLTRHPGGSRDLRTRSLSGSPRGPGFRRDDGSGPAFTATGTPPKRNGGRHCCRPPLSLVPLVLPEGETAFPREVPAEALRPRSVPQVPSQDHRWSGSGSCGFRSLPCGRSPVPWRVPSFSALRLRIPVPYRTPTKRSFFVSFRGSFRPGASGSAGPSKESGFGFGLRRRLALLPSGCPDLASFGFRPKTSAAFRGAVSGSTCPFPDGRSLPQEDHCTCFPSRSKR